MTETPGVYKIPKVSPKPSWETQLNSLPPEVRSVAESLAMRDSESAKWYVAQYFYLQAGCLLPDGKLFITGQGKKIPPSVKGSPNKGFGCRR